MAKKDNDLDEVMTSQEAADYLEGCYNITSRTFRTMRDAGKIPYLKFNDRVFRYLRSDLDDAIGRMKIRSGWQLLQPRPRV